MMVIKKTYLYARYYLPQQKRQTKTENKKIKMFVCETF